MSDHISLDHYLPFGRLGNLNFTVDRLKLVVVLLLINVHKDVLHPCGGQEVNLGAARAMSTLTKVKNC
jgi:hypothetical protein